MSVHPLPGEDRVVDGVRLYVVVHGRAAGRPPLLLVHGAPTSSYLWREVMRDLGHDVITVAPDLAGLGDSERPRRPAGPAWQARLLLELLSELGHERVLVVGHDLGGAVAVHLALLGAERVAGLALIGTPLHADAWPAPTALPGSLPGGRTLSAALARLAARSHPLGAPARALVTARLGRGRLPRGEGSAGGADREAALWARTSLSGDALLGADMEAMEAAWESLRLAPPPALVLWGEEDPITSVAYGRRLAGELPGAAWVPVFGAGHLLPLERPERVAEELLAFADELVPAPVRAPPPPPPVG